MAATAKGQPPSGVGRLAVSYADSLMQQKAQVKPVQMKPISYLHGEPQGHNAEQCYVEHPELYPEEKKGHEEDKKKAWKNSRREVDDKNGDRPTEKKEEEFVEQKYKKWGGGRN
uniref:Uncharacterized protein n=1 Tax=Solanum tuberosum TaxID=4113 RepID=M1DMS4_SOLTU